MSISNGDVLTQDQIREMNRVNILNFIKTQDETTKQDIAKDLNISVPTVTSIINQLIVEGYVKEAGVAKSTGGRKPVILKFRKDAKYSIGINIMPDQVELLLVNLKMEALDELNFHYEKDWDFETAINKLEIIIEELLEKNKIDKSKVLGVGISAPGIVDEDALILENAPNLEVKDYDFNAFKNRLGLPVYIENEANVAALAEVKLGNITNARNIVYVSITEGVGTGIVINRQIFKSANKKAGEFGHMRITSDTKRCSCGRIGCWEIYASKGALFKKIKDKTGINITRISEVMHEVKNKKGIDEALQEYMDNVLIGVENIILGLNPEYIVLGGELGSSEIIFSQYIQSSKIFKCSILEYEGTKIVFSSLRDQGAKVGAALLSLDTIFSYKKSILS